MTLEEELFERKAMYSQDLGVRIAVYEYGEKEFINGWTYAIAAAERAVRELEAVNNPLTGFVRPGLLLAINAIDSLKEKP